jgi:hypothetical protein
MEKSRFSALATVTIGLALALVVATGTRVIANSGGYYCGYGDCSLTYTDCAWTNYQELGGGECEVTVSPSCVGSVVTQCSGSEFQWTQLSSTWRARPQLECCE